MARSAHRERHELPGDAGLVRVRPARAERERADGVLVVAGGDSRGRAEPADRRVRHGAGRRSSALSLPQDRGYSASEGEILSPDGHCRPFDAARRNAVRQRRRLRACSSDWPMRVADGDQILAVVRGSAINNDGAQKVGYLAPSVERPGTRDLGGARGRGGVRPPRVSLRRGARNRHGDRRSDRGQGADAGVSRVDRQARLLRASVR